jgi:death on curing protein
MNPFGEWVSDPWKEVSYDNYSYLCMVSPGPSSQCGLFPALSQYHDCQQSCARVFSSPECRVPTGQTHEGSRWPMVRASQALTLKEIVEINRRMIQSFGGFFVPPENFENRGSLEHALEKLDAVLFGQELYPTEAKKAAALGWTIIAGHVFKDGNKRTGMMSCALFLDLNGYQLLKGYNDPEAMEIALLVASGEMNEAGFTEWVVGRATER